MEDVAKLSTGVIKEGTKRARCVRPVRPLWVMGFQSSLAVLLWRFIVRLAPNRSPGWPIPPMTIVFDLSSGSYIVDLSLAEHRLRINELDTPVCIPSAPRLDITGATDQT